jgi:hypothetical protein
MDQDQAVELQPAPSPDRKRDAGLRGDRLQTGILALTLVFLTGFALLVMVLMSRRRADQPSSASGSDRT